MRRGISEVEVLRARVGWVGKKEGKRQGWSKMNLALTSCYAAMPARSFLSETLLGKKSYVHTHLASFCSLQG